MPHVKKSHFKNYKNDVDILTNLVNRNFAQRAKNEEINKKNPKTDKKNVKYGQFCT